MPERLIVHTRSNWHAPIASPVSIRMNFRDVVICDNARCGAILRISERPGPISVSLTHGPFGTFVVCPRCSGTTLIDMPMDGDQGAPQTGSPAPTP